MVARFLVYIRVIKLACTRKLIVTSACNLRQCVCYPESATVLNPCLRRTNKVALCAYHHCSHQQLCCLLCDKLKLSKLKIYKVKGQSRDTFNFRAGQFADIFCASIWSVVLKSQVMKANPVVYWTWIKLDWTTNSAVLYKKAQSRLGFLRRAQVFSTFAADVLWVCGGYCHIVCCGLPGQLTLFWVWTD